MACHRIPNHARELLRGRCDIHTRWKSAGSTEMILDVRSTEEHQSANASITICDAVEGGCGKKKKIPSEGKQPLDRLVEGKYWLQHTCSESIFSAPWLI